MTKFGQREIFAIEYEFENAQVGLFEMWVHNVPVCCFCQKEGGKQSCKVNILSIVEWFNDNLQKVVTESDFPLQVEAVTSLDFYHKTGTFDSDDIDEFDKWYEIRQDWIFSHSWYSNRAGAYLADVFFRKSGNMIEIEWDNRRLYEGIHFVNEVGLYYVDIQMFQQVIQSFIESIYVS